MTRRSLSPGCTLSRAALLTICVAAAGCGTGGQGSLRTGTSPITAEELREAAPATVYEAVQRLRPNWLFRLGGVFLDDERFEVDALRTMGMLRVQRIELVSASEATARWNTRSISAPFLHVMRR